MAIIESMYFGQYSNPIHLSDSNSNKITILLGVNGTSKSRILRALLDDAVSSISENVPEAVLFSDIDLSNACLPTYYSRPKKVIAISSVPTDRFPTKSRFSTFRAKKTIHDINEYEYIGPKHNSNLVSRMQSLEALITLSLSNKKATDAQYDFIRKLSLKTNVPYNFNVRVLNAELMSSIISSDFVSGNGRNRVEDVLRAAPDIQEKINNPAWVSKSFMILKKIIESRELSFSLNGDINHDENYDDVLLDHLKIKSIKLSSKLSTYNTKNNNKKSIHGIDHFSSGQWGLFSSLSALSLSVVDNTMILIDEPESTLHPSWQRSYIDDLLQAISHVKGCHVFIATHSPLLVNSLPDGCGEIILLKKENNEISAKKIDSPPHGWSANDTLESFFDLESTRPVLIVNMIERALSLVSGGFVNNKFELTEILPELDELAESLPEEDDLKSIVLSLVKAIRKGVSK